MGQGFLYKPKQNLCDIITNFLNFRKQIVVLDGQ